MRLDWIDTLKGFAIFTVVLGHCVTDSMASNTYQEYKFIMKLLYDFIYSFHMPLFFVISGYLFYLTKSSSKFKEKALDYFIVYVFWSFLIWFSKYVAGGHVNNPVTFYDLFAILWHPILVLWYLYVLIVFYIIFSLINFKTITLKHMILLGLISFIIKFVPTDIGILKNCLYYAFFFVLGGYLYLNKIEIPKSLVAFSIMVCISNCINYSFYPIQISIELIILKGFIIANAATYILFYFFPKVNFFSNSSILKLLGKYSLQIYVIHCFITGGLRIAFKIVGINNFFLYFISGTLLGIIIPIIIAKVCEKNYILNIPFSPIYGFKQILK